MNNENKYLATAFSAVLATTVLGVTAQAETEENPFQLKNLPSGYMIAHDGQHVVEIIDGEVVTVKGQQSADADVEREGSGKGCNKLGSGQCGEGQCGTDANKDCEENLTGSKGDNSLGEGKCGEGQCGTDAVKK